MDQHVSPSTNPSAPVACLNCRDKHVKCDGNLSGCARCSELSLFCYFVPSRRGRKCRPSPYPPPLTDFLSVAMDQLENQSPSIVPDIALGELSAPPPAPVPDSSHLISLYYLHFHPAHPFLLPRDALLQSSPPGYLLQLVELVSLHYLHAGHVVEAQVMDELSPLRTAINDADDGLEKIQALLLLSLILHASVQPAQAKACATQAVHCCLDVGLHRPEFSAVLQNRSPLRAESARRTWWEIFILDTLLAAVQVHGSLYFALPTPDVPLPCDDAEYHSGGDQPVATVSEMAQQALFHDTDREFSTAAYRVEAATILRRCLLVGADRPSQEAVDLLDTSITSWFHRLPASMRGTLHYTGEVNEMAFQAQMIMHCASIYLHFPQSYLLTFLPKSSALLCARPPNLVLPSVNSHLHSSKVLNAAISLSKLASLSTSTVGHSPFFVCTLVISSTIQLAMLSIEQQRASNIWHYLSLNIGTIKSLAGTWRIAANSTERIRSVVTEVKGALEGGSVQPVDEIA